MLFGDPGLVPHEESTAKVPNARVPDLCLGLEKTCIGAVTYSASVAGHRLVDGRRRRLPVNTW